MQSYDGTHGLEKICLVFSFNPNKILFFMCDYGHEKRKRKKKSTMSYVVMFGYGKG